MFEAGTRLPTLFGWAVFLFKTFGEKKNFQNEPIVPEMNFKCSVECLVPAMDGIESVPMRDFWQHSSGFSFLNSSEFLTEYVPYTCVFVYVSN